MGRTLSRSPRTPAVGLDAAAHPSEVAGEAPASRLRQFNAIFYVSCAF
jgi:hypothetical protein